MGQITTEAITGTEYKKDRKSVKMTYEEYNEEKKQFFEKHSYDYRVGTSTMDEYSAYYKTYTFEDGAQWYEKVSLKKEQLGVTAESELAGRTVHSQIIINWMCTEYWSTEAASKYYYERT